MTRTVLAQVDPSAHYVTIRTQHFYVTYTPQLDAFARRTAVDAERAYAQLSEHLHPPRGPIDILVTDDVDYTNGSATPFPYNHIVLYANPPVFESALRFTDDPAQLVVTHELTHIFHLDRVRGIWRPAQAVFGRNPFTFPNLFSPSWLTEGLAVYYESLLTGSGRLVGREHEMIARSATIDHVFPRPDQVSLASPRFPYGYSVYAYGSLFIDHLARTYGDSAIRRFVESSSAQLVPLLIDLPARHAFGGAPFTRAWRQWALELTSTAPAAQPPMPGWRNLTTDGAYTSYPRWLSDTTIVYTGAPAKETSGAYELVFGRGSLVLGDRSGSSTTQDPSPKSQAPSPKPQDPGPTRRRIGRRDSRSPNSLLADGSLLYSQADFIDPYHLRSDLYVDHPGGGTTRLTHGARLALPDARADGLIAAVQIVPGGDRIALVSADGRHVTPITNGSLDEQWTEPRWSPDGRHIAAVRWTRGGTAAIVVIDTAGTIEETLIAERDVNATPSWSRDGRWVYFSSDRTGVPNLYRAPFRPAFADSAVVPGIAMLSDAQTGLFEPDVSPDSRTLAAVVFRSDGYHVGVAPLDSLHAADVAAIASVEPRAMDSASASTAVASAYSPWRTLRPRYWLPIAVASLGSGARLGGYTSGSDLVERHTYDALLLVPTDNSGIVGGFTYRNASLGQPLIDVAASQDWSNLVCRSVDCTGTVRRRIRDASLALTLLRPRVRTSAFLSVSGGIESRSYSTRLATLSPAADSFYAGRYDFPRVTASAGWGNTQRPPLSISPEDGLQIASTGRARWLRGDTSTVAISTVTAGSAFKSLPLWGYAHHVVALHAAYGWMTTRNPDYFEVGGISGGTLDVLPGYTLGEGQRSFGVRGFPAASLLGIRAAATSLEWRAPLTMPGRGLGLWPVFLDRTNVAVFGDAASAWCPAVFAPHALPISSLCTQSQVDNGVVFLDRKVIASAGAELNVTAATFGWDQPFRYRLGVAAPVAGRNLVPGLKPASAYLAIGASF